MKTTPPSITPTPPSITPKTPHHQYHQHHHLSKSSTFTVQDERVKTEEKGCVVGQDCGSSQPLVKEEEEEAGGHTR